MASLFASWTYQNIVDAINAVIDATVGKAGYEANREFVECNNHWQNGKNWPLAGTVVDAMRKKILLAVEPQFIAVDAIGEALDNVANGLLDREPSVTFAAMKPAKEGSDEEKQQQAEADAMLRLVSAWWDRKQFWEACKQATRRSRWATRGALRLFVTPVVMRRENNTTFLPHDLPIDDAFDAMQIMAPDPSSGIVYTDPTTQQKCGIFTYKTSEQPPRNAAELWYLEGDTVNVRIVYEGNGTAMSPFPVDIGKRLPITQMTAKLLIKETVRRQQNRLNFFETILVRLGETAGFRERYTMNAMPQGQWLDVPPTDGPALETQKDTTGKTWYLHQVPRTLGAAITTDLRGIPIGTGDKETVATPGVQVIEPTDPEFAIKSARHAHYTILHECKQGHLSNTSTAEASGNAYVQARAVFEKDLKSTKGPLENMVRDTIEALIAWVELLSRDLRENDLGVQPKFLDRFRCVVNLHVDAGPVSPEELAQIREHRNAGLFSDETAMQRSGVEDTAAEMAAIAATPRAIAELRTKQFAAVAEVSTVIDVNGALELVGFTEEERKKLALSDLSGGNVQQ